MYKKIHVYDLDGVLVDTSHRYRNKPDGSIDLDYWFANRTAKKISKDKLLPLAAQYTADTLNPEIYTVICTARAYHVLDIQFIVGYLGKPDKLIMRPEGNMRNDALLKYAQLNSLFNLRQFARLPRKLWEDNRRNIAVLRPLFHATMYVPSRITGK